MSSPWWWILIMLRSVVLLFQCYILHIYYIYFRMICNHKEMWGTNRSLQLRKIKWVLSRPQTDKIDKSLLPLILCRGCHVVGSESDVQTHHKQNVVYKVERFIHIETYMCVFAVGSNASGLKTTLTSLIWEPRAKVNEWSVKHNLDWCSYWFLMCSLPVHTERTHPSRLAETVPSIVVSFNRNCFTTVTVCLLMWLWTQKVWLQLLLLYKILNVRAEHKICCVS